MREIKKKFGITSKLTEAVLIILLCYNILNPLKCHAQPEAGKEYRVKAGFIYHFIRFTQWPEGTFKDSDSPFILCVASTYPVSDILSSLQDKMIKSRKLIIKKYENQADIENCHILFIASEDEKFISKRLNEAGTLSILTIGEMKDFSQLGGIINFFTERQNLRFAVNLNSAKQAGLKLSAQLLMSAKIFQEEH